MKSSALVLVCIVFISGSESRPAPPPHEPPIDELMETWIKSKENHEKLLGILKKLSEDELKILETMGPTPIVQTEEFVQPQELNLDDMMMGDMPALPVQNASTSSNYSLNDTNDDLRLTKAQLRARNKESRLSAIKDMILMYLGRKESPSLNNSMPNPEQRQVMMNIYEQMPLPPHWGEPIDGTEKVQSFYPSCELPKHWDEELWSRSKTMNLHFDLNITQPSPGTTIRILSAKLRLFKLSQDCVQTNGTGEGCSVPEDNLNKASVHFPTPVSPLTGDERMIRVTVSWYSRPLRKDRPVRRKLLDSRMISVFGEATTEWNVKTAIKSWHESGSRNHGIAVQVEDEDGHTLPADRYFAPMNCSKEATTARPLPGFLIDAARTYNLNDSKSRRPLAYDPYIFPMIELRTMEQSESEASNNMLGVSLPHRPSYSSSLSPRVSPVEFTGSRHRVRHHHDVERSVVNGSLLPEPTPVDSMEQIPWEDASNNQTVLKILGKPKLESER